MGVQEVSASRLERVRELMVTRGYDAVVVRDVAGIRWLTGAARVLDGEEAHTLLVGTGDAWLHTDSRYFGAFAKAMGEGAPIVVDMDDATHSEWLAGKVGELKARVVAIEDTVSLGFFEEFEAALNRASRACLLPRLHGDLIKMRMVKDDEEMALLRRAQQITDQAFDHICAHIQPGMTELAIRAELEGYMLKNGAHALSFDSIVGSGPNGANPHARPSERVVETGDLIVIDFGAAYADYHADMTRTVSVGRPTEEQQRVYDVVRRAHEVAAEAARPNMAGKELHRIAASVIEEAGYGDFFKHGLGHGVGIEIHERPFEGARSMDAIPVGSVFTIEPGIYLPGRFGIRLEDFGAMGEDGYEPFTESTHELVCVG